MKKLIVDLDNNRELTAYYTESQCGICVRDIFVYDDGNESNYDSDITGDTLEEVKKKLQEQFTSSEATCDICGKKFEEGQTIYKTESGKIACSLVELLTELSGHEVN